MSEWTIGRCALGDGAEEGSELGVVEVLTVLGRDGDSGAAVRVGGGWCGEGEGEMGGWLERVKNGGATGTVDFEAALAGQRNHSSDVDESEASGEREDAEGVIDEAR